MDENAIQKTVHEALRAQPVTDLHTHCYTRRFGASPDPEGLLLWGIDELITYTEKWLRRFEESWFDLNDFPATDLGFNHIGNIKMIPDLCDYAIEAVTQLAKFATEAESRLAEVKKDAERRMQEESSDGVNPQHNTGKEN